MTVRALWHLIRFYWVMLIVATSMGIAAGWGLASTAQTEYTANAEVFVLANSSRDAGDINQAATYARDQARNFAAVATRAMVLQPVIDDVNLDLSVSQLRSKVSTSVPLNTSIISISVTDTSAPQAAKIANGVADSLTRSITRLVPERNNKLAVPVQVQSVERATVPQVPSGPRSGLLALLGGLVALALALLLLGVRDYFRGKVQTAEQASAVTRSPVLGSVSKQSGRRQPLVIAAAPNSTHAEQYRQIRANLQALRKEPGHHVFVLTSSVPGEGRSTAAANIAATIAAAGTRVCLVEADLHRPSLATSLELEPGPGLTALLTGKAKLEDVLQPWGEDGLQVLVAGSSPRNPSELLASRQAESFLTKISDQFEVTIIDAPPVLPVADATILARLFGGAIMVVSARKVRVRELAAAVERMSLVGTPVIGTILTMSGTPSRSKRLHDGYVSGSTGKSSGGSTKTPARPEQNRPVTKLNNPRGASISARVHGA